MHKRLKLGDGYQRSSDDDTSSGCSSSGGGLRNGNIIITPPRDSSSISSSNKPYYGMDDQSHLQHQQPKNGMLSSRNNSFSPYSIRPLVVRAKRKRSEGTSVNVTSTAQRIIDTLNSFSTPVVNSSKVPFDSLKNFRPIVTPIRRDTHGPPIMKSPLVPAPEGKIYYNPAMNIHIPRLVEFGTNTDLTMSTFTYDHLEELNSNPSKGVGGGKMKLTSRVHSAPIKPNEPPSLPPQLNNQIISSSMIEPSKFRFNSSWGPANVHKSLGSDQMYVVFTSNGTYAGQTATSLCRKCRAHLTQPDVLSPTTTTTAMTMVKDTIDDKKSDANIPLKIAMPPPTNTWNCPTCLVINKLEASTCVCCGEKNPTVKATTTAAKNWECPTCMVQNKPEASSCVCCSEKNPNASKVASIPSSTSSSSSFQFGFKPTTTSDTTTSLSKPTTPLSTFTFGAPATTSSSATTTKSTFTFGVTNSTSTTKTDTLSSNSSATPAAFAFGTSSSSSKPETPNKTAMITTTTTTTETPKSSFTFGTASSNSSINNSSAAAKPSPIPVSFGVPAEPSAATAVKSSTTFGLPTKAPEVSLSARAATPPTIEKPLVSQSPPNNPFGSFAFGTTKTTSNLSGVIKDDADFWQCDKCPARSRNTSNHCVVCLAPKPTADTSNKSKPTSVKRFHFEPFFGGKVDDSSSANQNQITSSYQEEELKRKAPSSSTSSGSGSSLGFTYTPPSEPALKLKTPEPAPSGGQPTAASEIKTGSFLDALKQGSQFTFSSPSPGTSIIPSGTTPLGGQQPSTTTVPASVMTVSPIPSTTSNAPATAVSSTTSSWGGPPPGLFQFGAPANMNTTPTGSNANAAMNMTGNNISNNNGLKTTMFTFGGMKNGPVVPTPSSTPSIFGSSLSTGGVTTTPSVFGAPSIAAPAAAVSNPVAATSPFSLTPNINFMSPGAGAPAPGSFVFNAQPSPGGGSARDGGMGQRKFRKATRRIRQ